MISFSLIIKYIISINQSPSSTSILESHIQPILRSPKLLCTLSVGSQCSFSISCTAYALYFPILFSNQALSDIQLLKSVSLSSIENFTMSNLTGSLIDSIYLSLTFHSLFLIVKAILRMLSSNYFLD